MNDLFNNDFEKVLNQIKGSKISHEILKLELPHSSRIKGDVDEIYTIPYLKKYINAHKRLKQFILKEHLSAKDHLQAFISLVCGAAEYNLHYFENEDKQKCIYNPDHRYNIWHPNNEEEFSDECVYDIRDLDLVDNIPVFVIAMCFDNISYVKCEAYINIITELFLRVFNEKIPPKKSDVEIFKQKFLKDYKPKKKSSSSSFTLYNIANAINSDSDRDSDEADIDLTLKYSSHICRHLYNTDQYIVYFSAAYDFD